MPEQDVVQRWMSEVTTSIVSNNHRLEAVEKSVDEQRKVSERATQALERIAKAEEDRTKAQERLASTEEERTKLLQQTERDRKKAERDQSTLDAERASRVDAWMVRLWNAPQMQMLFTVLLLALTQFLGFGWLAQRLVPPLPLTPPTATQPASEGSTP